MISRELINPNVRYKTNEYNSRYGCPEEKYTNFKDIEKRINYWKYIFYKTLRLEKGSKMCFCFSHTGIDSFAVIFAAAELSMIVVPINSADDIDVFIHTLNESSKIYKKLSIKSKRIFHQTDLADSIINDSLLVEKIAAKRPTDDEEFLIGISHKQSFELLNHYPTITGTVLHTKTFQTNNSILNTIHSLTQDTISEHVGLGYNNLIEGMPKIILLLQEFKINNIFLNNHNEILEFEKYDLVDVNAILVDSVV